MAMRAFPAFLRVGFLAIFSVIAASALTAGVSGVPGAASFVQSMATGVLVSWVALECVCACQVKIE